ncbi:MAG: DUF1700 domain-containing protein [Clostridiales bacterium]|jgi:uncharacterized membrane protein|nr:DUF1700 domain-containing protein [Clostridiales bacterium]
MKKAEFMKTLANELTKTVGRAEADKALIYYGELIDDAIESGRYEDEIVSRLPPPSEIARQIQSVQTGGEPVGYPQTGAAGNAAAVNYPYDRANTAAGYIQTPPVYTTAIAAVSAPPQGYPPQSYPPQPYAPPPIYSQQPPPAAAAKKHDAAYYVFKTIGLTVAFFWLTVAMVILIAVIGSLAVSLIGIAAGFTAGGAASVVYAATAFTSLGGAVTFAFLGGGLLVIGLSVFVWQGAFYCGKALFKIIKAIIKSFIGMVKGKKRGKN